MQILSKRIAFKELLIFTFPIIFGQVGLMLIGTGDMVIAGKYSRECLAAIGLAIAILNPIQISALGMQFCIGPILAQKLGNHEKIEDKYWTIIYYSIFTSFISGILSIFSYYLVPILDYGPQLNRIIQEYILITSFSTFGIGIYQAIKEFYQAQEKTFLPNSVAILLALANLGINYVLVFGAFGFPELKEAGLAWASLICRILMALLLLMASYKYWASDKKMDWVLAKSCWKIGLPISAALFFEVMAFCSVTLFVGRFPEVQIAANNLALNIGSLSFMIPLSISSAVAVKVGHAYGERNIAQIKVYSLVSILMGISFAVLSGTFCYLFPEFVLSFYTMDEGVIAWGKVLLFWVACFQLFDGIQVVISGVLRGLSLTRPSSIAIFIGYWILGIPLGYYLGFHASMEAQGFWIGLAVSLAIVAAILSVVLRREFKKIRNLHSL